MESTWWTQPEELDDDQKAIISLGLEPDHLILGPPGSGKTNLLILRAAHLYAAGMKNIVVLTFGRVLREFLAAGSANYPFPPNKVQTYVRWGAEQASMAGEKLENSRDFKIVRQQLFSALTKTLESSGGSDFFDCIFIDESQDYAEEEMRLIGRFAKRIFAVGDDSQRIYENSGAIEFLKANIASVHTLKHHYRNGIKICRLADGIMGFVDSPLGLESTSNYIEAKYPSTVTPHGSLDLVEQFAIALPEIQTQLRAYPNEMIGVLCPRKSDVRRIWNEIASAPIAANAHLQLYSDGYSALDADRRIVVATMHSAKGLEFRALHLFAMDAIGSFKARQKRLAYTAVTRAKTSLSIYHNHALPGYLERGIEAATGAGVLEPPSLSQLFAKKA